MNRYYVQYDLYDVEGLPPRVCRGHFDAKSQHELFCELKDKHEPHKIEMRVVQNLSSTEVIYGKRKTSISSKMIITFMGFVGFAMTMGATIGQIFFN